MLLMAAGLFVGQSAWSADSVVQFSAKNTATSNQGFTNGATTEITTNITISGGRMYAVNNQTGTGTKNLQTSSGFSMTNNNTYFKIVLNRALVAGDVISAKYTGGTKNSANKGLYVSSTETTTGNLGSVPACNATSSSETALGSILSYVVESSDEYVGKTTLYIYRAVGATQYFDEFKVTTPAVAPDAITFSPAAGSVAQGTSVTLTSSGATTILYQWSSAAIDGEGDWSGAETYSSSNKPEVPAVGSANTVLSVKASNVNGSTYGSASYTPVKMALKTIYSFADGIGTQEVSAASATIDDENKQMYITNTAGRIKLTAASGFQFKNGDAISFSGTIGNTAKNYGIKYGPDTNLGTNLYVTAGEACNVSGTLSLASATNDLYIGRYDGTNTYFTSFTVRQLTEATSEAFTGVKIGGSAATEDVDYTIEGSTITLTGSFTATPNVVLVNHIVFADESVEDQNLVVPFGNPDGEFFTGTVTIDGTEYTVKAPCGNVNALKVQYKSGETVIKEENFDVTGYKVGASYTVPFRMYVEKDGALYQTTKNGSNPWYGDAVALAYNTTITKTLSSVDLGGGTIELFEDLDDGTGENADVRASYGSAYVNKAYTSTEDLTAGIYKFIVKAQNKGRNSSVKVGNTTVFKISDVNSGTGSWTDNTITDIIVPEAGKLALVDGGSSYDDYDIIIAIRTGALPSTETIQVTSAGYATYVSNYNLDFSSATTKAYKVKVDEKAVATLTPVSQVPAKTPVLLYVSGGNGEGEAIPVTSEAVAAVSGNDLELGTGAEVATVDGDYTNMILNNGTEGIGFYFANGQTVATNRAYLHIPTDMAPAVSSARPMVINFEGMTGINSVKGEELMVNGSEIYNLQGQRVAQPTKGLYIINGKKVMVK